MQHNATMQLYLISACPNGAGVGFLHMGGKSAPIELAGHVACGTKHAHSLALHSDTV